MLNINVGNYSVALAYNQNCGDTPALTVVGHLILTDEQWSKLGHDYASNELSQAPSTKRVENVFCNNENFLNGVRVAIFEAKKTNDEIGQRFKIQFFDGHTARPHDLVMDKDARFNYCPRGFFEQTENDLLKLF